MCGHQNRSKEPTPDRLTYELFDRVNRGRTRLNNQEMRNAIYQGSATLYLKTLSRLAIFKELTKSIPSTRMKDRYLVLRFVAFYLWRKKLSKDTRTGEIIDYKSDLEDFLARSMDFMNTKTYQTEDLKIDQLLIVENNTLCIEGTHKTIIIEADTLLHNVSISFAQALQNIQHLFGGNSFRLPPKKDGGNTRPINMALFEVTVYFFIELETEFASKSALIKTQYEALIDNKIFAESQLEEDNFVSSVSNSV